MKTLGKTLATISLGLGVALAAPLSADAKDYLLTGTKANQLVMVDAAKRTVARVYDLPDAGPGPSTITPSRDGKVAYVVVNKWESVTGIDLDTGEQVFRADLSGGDERAKVFFGMDVSPDGKQLAVYVNSVRLGAGEYKVQPARIDFYNLADGVGAKPVHSIPAPRQVTILMYAEDGSKLYGMGRALYEIDPENGDIIKENKTQTWDRENYSPPDVLDVWSQFEQAGIFSTPYYAVRLDKDPMDPTAYITGMLTMDLGTGEFDLIDVENTDVFYFSSVVSPTNPDHAFGVYNNLSKLDIGNGEALGRVDLDHSYYDINISSDGKEVYLGGTLGDIAVYDTETLEKIGVIQMPGLASQAISNLRVIQR